jgi:hypothetical protein
MARGSAYGDMIKMPSWVFGGEFGDISNLLNKRDQAYEETENAEITNDRNQIRLEEEQRKVDINEEMRKRGVFGDSGDQPVTLRDMYEKRRDIAMELGSYGDAIEMEKQLADLDRKQQQDELTKRYREAMIESRSRTSSGDRPSSGGSNRLFQLENPETGEKGVFRADEANQKLADGWDFYKRDELAELLGDKNNKPAPAKPGGVTEFLKGLGQRGADKPGEAEANKQKSIVEQIKAEAVMTERPARPPRPGMKWIRNKKTGELKEVPE